MTSSVFRQVFQKDFLEKDWVRDKLFNPLRRQLDLKGANSRMSEGNSNAIREFGRFDDCISAEMEKDDPAQRLFESLSQFRSGAHFLTFFVRKLNFPHPKRIY